MAVRVRYVARAARQRYDAHRADAVGPSGESSPLARTDTG